MSVLLRSGVGEAYRLALDRHLAEKIADLRVQACHRGLNRLRCLQHGLRRGSRPGRCAGHLAERRGDDVASLRGGGDIQGDLAGGGVLLLDRGGHCRRVTVDLLHARGDAVDGVDRALG